MSKIRIAENFEMEIFDYASQANAILGIRDSGKSYTAMKIAEELLENKVPIIGFDPVSIWRYLKVPNPDSKFYVKSFKGYPVVVVGGPDPDLLLNPKNAEYIIEAALEENISLIFDFYSMGLHKTEWRSIIEHAVRYLMFNNTGRGLKHVFIEEAAEFVPQRLKPQDGKVYSEIERLVRMGRNASLGVTLINQRAEEINKAVFELCAITLMHKQVGKNSLKSIKEWLERGYVEDADKILKSLSQLKQGQTWVVGQINQPEPQLIQVMQKKTFHPNPKNPDPKISKMSMDVSGFVARLNKQLDKKKTIVAVTESKPEKTTKQKDLYPYNKTETEKIIFDLESDNAALRETVETQEKIIEDYKLQETKLRDKLKVVNKAKELINFLKVHFKKEYGFMQYLFEDKEINLALEPLTISYIGDPNPDRKYNVRAIGSLAQEYSANLNINTDTASWLSQVDNKFLKNAITQLFDSFKQLDPKAIDMVHWLESSTKGVARAELFRGAFGAGKEKGAFYMTNNKILKEAIKSGWIRTDVRGTVYKNVSENIKNKLSANKPSNDILERVYNHLIK